MAPRTIQPQDTVISCAVCGRTLLQGEHPEIYLVNGTRRSVCISLGDGHSSSTS